MSHAWWQWVASTDSLTTRLTRAGKERAFRVKLLRQEVGRPLPDEARALGIPLGRHAWLREVALCLDETPWVVARSVAPLSQLRGQRLERLGERSLGSWLFQQPDLVRGPLEVSNHSARFAQAELVQAKGPWARRSVFRHGALSLLVQEYFLTEMADELALPSR
ncbi:chorismate lyase [Halomonas sp. ZH2S]|uniref:Probable chorismate pyruvate-lyase n=1 Tax=Vreelandella zhuhanensis TaxID=2684210 RepID=A0A7X3KQN3_9GAMM|nr:chorismate lyase [Halomonas zhuhanensis]MWJ28093.1 chorismate lyase [Halomonas zhuhanensis]